MPEAVTRNKFKKKSSFLKILQKNGSFLSKDHRNMNGLATIELTLYRNYKYYLPQYSFR